MVYSLLHQLVFGDDRSEDALGAVEEGKASSVPKTRETAAEMTGSEYWGKLVVCVVGLQASYLTWGVLQVTCRGVLLSTPYRNFNSGYLKWCMWLFLIYLPYSAYISQVFNFVNLESLAKFIQLKFEPLRCNIHGQHEFAKFIQRIPSKQLFTII